MENIANLVSSITSKVLNSKKYLNNFSWTNILGINFETTYTSFHMQFSKFFKTSFPEKNIKICYKNRLPYLTKINLKTHTEIPEESYSENKLLCTTFNNKLTSLLRIREKEYIEEQLELNKSDLPRT